MIRATLRKGTRRDVAILVPGFVVPGLASFLGLTAVSHLAGSELLGTTSLSWVTATFLSAVLTAGPGQVAVRSLSVGQPEAVPQLRGALLLRIAMVVPPLFVVGAVLAGFDNVFGDPLRFGALITAAQSVASFEAEVAKGERRFARSSAINCSRSVLSWSAAVVGATIHPSVAFILVPNAAGTLLTVVIFGSVRVRKPDPIVGEELRALGRPLSFLAVASYALGYADRYVILAMLGPPAVGVYSLGYQLGEGTLEAVSAPLTNALQSRLISEWTDPMAGPSVATATAKRGAAVLLIGSAVAIPGLVLANTLGVLSLISEDHRLVFVAVLVAPAAGIQGITRLSQALLLAERKTRQAMMCFWQVVFLSAITVPLLTRAAGIVGTAVATLLGYSCLAGLTARQALRARNNHAA